MKNDFAGSMGVGLIVAMIVMASGVPAAAQTARERYATLQAREPSVRNLIAAISPDAPASARADVIRQTRRLIASYEALANRHHSTGYADNALWNGAALADALHRRLGRAPDKALAVRLQKRLVAEYPSSSLVRRAAISDAEPAVNRPVERTLESPKMPSASGVATLMSIERTLLPEAVRIVVALDREVAYREVRLSGPERVYFDLKDVQPAATLRDAVLRYGTDAVRQVRVGRHPNSTVRVVLDLDGVTKYSAYTMYNPFRLVIDCESATRSAAVATTAFKPQESIAGPGPASAPALALAASPIRSSNAVAGEPPPMKTVIETTPMTLDVAPVVPIDTVAPAPVVTPERTETRSAPPAAIEPAPPVASGSPNRAGGYSLSRQLGLGVSRVVIDPGHGGHDPGALAKGVTEAELTLDIALRLEQLLQKDGVEVVLTRRTNVYVPLEERTAIANREAADLFLSIHANASRNDEARGVETYFLSFASSADAEAVAARENAGASGAMHNLPEIIKAIALNNKLDESRDFASMVQEALVNRLRRANKSVRNLGVKKAPFVVLIGAEMPSVLAEVSFLTNRLEAQLLKSNGYKQRIAEALHASVLRYRRSLKGQQIADRD